MNADSYYEIGHGHIICEDYALAENGEDLAIKGLKNLKAIEESLEF